MSMANSVSPTTRPGSTIRPNRPSPQSLPKRAEAFSRRETRPFFAGLLPEEAQREAVAKNLGISEGNDFRLLEALGGDVAGALTLWPEGETPPTETGLSSAQPLTDAELTDILDTLPKRPMLAGRDGLRLSLAGAQQQLPVVRVNGRIALPQPGQPTTHVLKPPIARFPATTENEAFAMRIAKRATLDEFRPNTWETFADDIGIGVPYTRRRVRELAQAITEHGPQLVVTLRELGLDVAALSQYSDLICARGAVSPGRTDRASPFSATPVYEPVSESKSAAWKFFTPDYASDVFAKDLTSGPRSLHANSYRAQ